MTPEILASRAEVLNRLPEVRWDRCAGTEASLGVYGWIPRDDGRFDFVVVEFQLHDGRDVCWFTTSSARLSATFAELLHGAAGPHYACRRVNDVFGSLLEATA